MRAGVRVWFVTFGVLVMVPLVAFASADSGGFRFSAASYVVAASSGSAAITVTRREPGGAAEVGYATSSGTASAGEDFVPARGRLEFAPGQSRASFTVSVRDAGVPGARTVHLHLLSHSPLSLDRPSSATLTIVDG